MIKRTDRKQYFGTKSIS